MMERIAESSPRSLARIAGALYLLSLLTAGFGEIFLRGRWGIAAGLIAVSGMVAVTLLFYDIFKPVNRGLSLLAAFFSLVGLTFEALRWNPRGVDIRSGISRILLPPDRLPDCQVDLSASNSRRANGVCRFGLADLSVTAARNYLSPYNTASGLLGEGSVFLWLLVMGVNGQRWKEQASAAAVRV